MTIVIHKEEDFIQMRKVGQFTSMVLDYIADFVQPGVSTLEINNICHQYILGHNYIPAPLGYQGFPKSICTSVNSEVCHGIPSEKKILKNGDIINIDVSVILEGWYGDSSRMYCVGKCKLNALKLVQITEEVMWEGIKSVKPGNTTGDIGYVIEKYAKKHGYSTVYEYTGHGIGRSFHSEPSILNFGNPGEGIVLQKGMFFTIEPMVNIGKRKVSKSKDGWTIITSDRSLSAQFEHTVAVTDTGYEIFTLGKLSNILD